MGRFKEIICNYEYNDNYINIVNSNVFSTIEKNALLIDNSYTHILVNEQYLLWTVDSINQYLFINKLEQLPSCLDYFKPARADYFPIYVIDLNKAVESANSINDLHTLADHQFI